MDLLENFRNKQIIRSQISCPQDLNIWLDHCQYIIHVQFDKNSKDLYKFKKRKHEISPFFQLAFQALNRQEKVLFYIRIVQHIQNLSKGIQKSPPITQVKMKPIQDICECRSFNLKIWKLKNIRIDRTRHQIMVQNEKDNKIKSYDLRNYILRKSKTKGKHALVLQAINQKPHEKSRTVHINFKNAQKLRFWFNLVKQQVQVCEWLNVKDMYYGTDTSHPDNSHNNSSISQQSSSQNNSQIINSSVLSIEPISKKQTNEIAQHLLFKQQQKLQKQEEELFGKRKTFIDHLVMDDCTNIEEFFDVIDDQTEKDVQNKKNLDFFHKLMPDYELDELVELAGYQTIVHQNGVFHILKHLNNPYKFKIVVTFNDEGFTPKQIFCLISEPKFALSINDNVEEQTIKTLLKSENSAIMYQTLKAYNKFYRSRDFVFVRHAFTHNNNFYLIDKSLDNINFPPFMTLVRGEISAVWGIIKDEKSQEAKLYGDFAIINSGLLNDQQEVNLSLKYLNGFKQLLSQQPDSGIESSMFDIDWNIDKKEVNKQFEEIRVRRKTIQVQKTKLKGTENQAAKQPQNISFSKKSSSYYDGESSPERPQVQVFKQHKIIEVKPKQQSKKQISTIQQSQKSEHIIAQKQTNHEIPRQINHKNKSSAYTSLQVTKILDKNGFVLMDKGYVSKKFITSPIQKQHYIEYKKIKGHTIWRGDWIHDTKQGGMIYVNQKKMQDQKGVLKFILTKIGKNILSGKSILNISLPVDIFSTESNLQRLLLSMAYGPKLLQNLHERSLLQKLAQVVGFGVSNSVLYLNIEKPFNPILGETFQCWINGCPGYGQQISHHPPIAALMFYGRGYRVTCQLQSKVELHMNSGCGTNDGIYKVQFDDGTSISFMTPGGQISGLTFGQRRFNIVGKSYYWIEKERIFLQLNFEAGKKGFFSKQEKPCDFFEGKIYEVTAEFFKVFPKSKKREPTDKEKVKELGRFEGVWNKYVKFNDKEILNFDQTAPLCIEYETQPLASDSNWREDIKYRRLNKITRAQTQKQRLQVLQRADRKFREKYKKK